MRLPSEQELKSRRNAWLKTVEKFGYWAENFFILTLVSALIFLSVAQIILRNVFSWSFVWGDGLIRLLVLWLALAAAIAASRDDKMIAVDLLSRVLPERWKNSVALLTNLFTGVVTGLLAFFSWTFVEDSRIFGDTLLGGWPAWVCQIILPFGFSVISYRYCLYTVKKIFDLD